jgi:hypothetical protein
LIIIGGITKALSVHSDMAIRPSHSKKIEVSGTGPGKVPVKLIVNDQEYEIYMEPRRTLLDALRKDLGLTRTKISITPSWEVKSAMPSTGPIWLLR